MLIAGAGGFALQLIPSLNRLFDDNDILFFDNSPNGPRSYISQNFIVITDLNDLRIHFLKHSSQFITAIGGRSRKRFNDLVVESGGTPVKIIDPLSSVSTIETTIDEGSIVLQDVIIEPYVKIGKGCILNVRCQIHHEVVIGDFTEIAPGAILLGNSSVGSNCMIGAGAIILPGVKVEDYCIIGAGAVVQKNIPAYETAVGVPAKSISKQ